MTEFYGFLDESGNHDLEVDKPGASKYYVLTTVIVKNDKLKSLEDSIEGIRKKYYGSGEIKSSKTDERRRMQVITDLLDVDFYFYAIATDKAAVRKDSGLIYKRSFLKFINGLLYNALVRSFQDIEIRADEHGHEEFMAGFRAYIRDNHIPDLFKTSDVCHVSSHDSVLVQLADFLSGTVRKIYEGGASEALKVSFIKLLKKNKVGIEEWPPLYSRQTYDGQTMSEFDDVIYRVAMNAASLFISENQSVDDEKRVQLLVLRYLLFNAKFGANEYVSTNEILEHLSAQGYVGISEHQLKSTVISRLRDSDVVISSSNRGYKIPQTYQDFMDFVELVNGQSIPLLERLSRAKRAVSLASQGAINALDEPKHTKLRKVVEALEKTDLAGA
jgi:hypothetical protein